MAVHATSTEPLAQAGSSGLEAIPWQCARRLLDPAVGTQVDDHAKRREDPRGQGGCRIVVCDGSLRRARATPGASNHRRVPDIHLRFLEYDVILHHAEGDKVRLKLVSDPGDQGEPVLTLRFPWQD